MIQTEEFYAFLDNSTSPFYVVENSSEILDRAGFMYLSFEEPWSLEKGGSYYKIGRAHV